MFLQLFKGEEICASERYFRELPRRLTGFRSNSNWLLQLLPNWEEKKLFLLSYVKRIKQVQRGLVEWPLTFWKLGLDYFGLSSLISLNINILLVATTIFSVSTLSLNSPSLEIVLVFSAFNYSILNDTVSFELTLSFFGSPSFATFINPWAYCGSISSKALFSNSLIEWASTTLHGVLEESSCGMLFTFSKIKFSWWLRE